MTPLVNAIWRSRMAGLLWRRGIATSLAGAWSAAGEWWWNQFRDAGVMPRQALAMTRGDRLP